MEAAWLLTLEQLKTAIVQKKAATFCCEENCSQGVANVGRRLSSNMQAEMMKRACCSCCWLKANHFEVWRRYGWRCHGGECWGRYVKTANLPQGSARMGHLSQSNCYSGHLHWQEPERNFQDFEVMKSLDQLPPGKAVELLESRKKLVGTQHLGPLVPLHIMEERASLPLGPYLG